MRADAERLAAERAFFAHLVRHTLSKSAPHLRRDAFGDEPPPEGVEPPPDPLIVLSQDEDDTYAKWIDKRFEEVGALITKDPVKVLPEDAPDSRGDFIRLWQEWRAAYADFKRDFSTSLSAAQAVGGLAGYGAALQHGFYLLRIWHKHLREVSEAMKSEGTLPKTYQVAPPPELSSFKAFVKEAAREFQKKLDQAEDFLLILAAVAGGILLAQGLRR